jgi:hypothetical protein
VGSPSYTKETAPKIRISGHGSDLLALRLVLQARKHFHASLAPADFRDINQGGITPPGAHVWSDGIIGVRSRC